MEISLKILTSVDRPHITYEFIRVLFQNDVGVLKMEVYSNIVYIKIKQPDEQKLNQLIRGFEKVDGFLDLRIIRLMASEEKDAIVAKTLDVIPFSVAILDSVGNIAYANTYSLKQIFHSSSDLVVGRHINRFIPYLTLDQLKEMKDKESRIEMLSIQGAQWKVMIQSVVATSNIFAGYILSFSLIEQPEYSDNLITFDNIISEDKKMIETVEQARMYSPIDSSVLICGESGTGKELFARSIHNASRRYDKPFIAINCAAIPEQLLESELFGYEPGSFTGGNKDGKKGVLERARGGTVFLDEIGEMSFILQAKLLRVLESNTIRRIGGVLEIPIDVRFITATNQDIERLILEKRFRMDLYYRINTLSLYIPPLRERKDDIDSLVQHFIKQYRKNYFNRNVRFSQDALKKLKSYDWPGNVRELFNVLERTSILCQSPIIDSDCVQINERTKKPEELHKGLHESLFAVERELILEELCQHKSIRQAAIALKVTHTLLLRRIEKYAIQPEEWQ